MAKTGQNFALFLKQATFADAEERMLAYPWELQT